MMTLKLNYIFKDSFGINTTANSDICHLNYQTNRQNNSIFADTPAFNFENTSDTHAKINNLEQNSNRTISTQFSDSFALGPHASSSFHHQSAQTNFILNPFESSLNQMSNEQLYETYDNFKTVQQFSENDWKHIQALNYFTDPVSTQHIFDNIQYKSNQHYYSQTTQPQQFDHQNHPDYIIPTMLPTSSLLVDKSTSLTKDDKTKRKTKKSRVLFSQWQINELEKLFKKQKYVTANEREIISKRLRLNPNQVKIWFQNRRYKIKKKSN